MVTLFEIPLGFTEEEKYFVSTRLSLRFHITYARKACKSLAFGSWLTSFSSVLPTSQVGYHAGKPIERVVYYFYKIILSFLWVYRHNKPKVFNQSERAYYLRYFINAIRNRVIKPLISSFGFIFSLLSSSWRESPTPSLKWQPCNDRQHLLLP